MTTLHSLKPILLAATVALMAAGSPIQNNPTFASYAQPEGNGNVVTAQSTMRTSTASAAKPEGNNNAVVASYDHPEGNNNAVVSG